MNRKTVGQLNGKNAFSLDLHFKRVLTITDGKSIGVKQYAHFL